MSGDAKSPQHTSVHPMYVSYSSIPTSASATMAALKNNLLNNTKINNVSNTNTLSSSQKFNSNRNSGASFNNNIQNATDNRYTIVSTEKLVNDNETDLNQHETYMLNSFNSNNNSHSNEGYIPHPRPNQSIIEINDFDSIDSRDHIPFITEIRSGSHTDVILANPLLNQHRINHEITENYKMPLQYITRSPNLNRVASRRRNERPVINFCDKIRDTPPGYNESQIMQRAKSQDRLSFRRQRLRDGLSAGGGSNGGSGSNRNSRPRSYCSNGYPEERENVP